MFGLVRIVFGLLILIVVNIITVKLCLHKKRRYYILSTILAVGLITISMFFPIENIFITFSSPEASFKYYTWKPTTNFFVAEGKNSDLVIAHHREADTLLLIPKTDEGWKIGIGKDTRKVKQAITNDVIISIYQYKHTNDYFITVLNLENTPVDIIDACNSVFYKSTNDYNAQEQSTTLYCASIHKFNKDYWVRINGETISFVA